MKPVFNSCPLRTVRSIALCSDNSSLVVGGNKFIFLYSLSRPHLKKSLIIDEIAIKICPVSSNYFLLGVLDSGNIFLHSLQTLGRISSFSAHASCVHVIVPLPDINRLLTSSLDSTFALWKLGENGEEFESSQKQISLNLLSSQSSDAESLKCLNSVKRICSNEKLTLDAQSTQDYEESQMRVQSKVSIIPFLFSKPFLIAKKSSSLTKAVAQSRFNIFLAGEDKKIKEFEAEKCTLVGVFLMNDEVVSMKLSSDFKWLFVEGRMSFSIFHSKQKRKCFRLNFRVHSLNDSFIVSSNGLSCLLTSNDKIFSKEIGLSPKQADSVHPINSKPFMAALKLSPETGVALLQAGKLHFFKIPTFKGELLVKKRSVPKTIVRINSKEFRFRKADSKELTVKIFNMNPRSVITLKSNVNSTLEPMEVIEFSTRFLRGIPLFKIRMSESNFYGPATVSTRPGSSRFGLIVNGRYSSHSEKVNQ